MEEVVLVETAVDFEVLEEAVPVWTSEDVYERREVLGWCESVGVESKVEDSMREVEEFEEERGADGGEGGEVQMERFEGRWRLVGRQWRRREESGEERVDSWRGGGRGGGSGEAEGVGGEDEGR